MNENAEREAFEKWWGETGSFQSDQDLTRQAWKARASLSAPPALGEVVEQASSAHAAAMARIAEAGRRLSYNVDLAQSLATFSDFWGLDCYTPQTATMNAVRDIVRALLALSQAAPPAALAQAEGQPAPAHMVKVKPLEWVRNPKDDETGFNESWTANGVGGVYSIENRGRFGFDVWDIDQVDGARFDYLDDAKEFAQADHEPRVRSALIEPAPAPAGVSVETIAEIIEPSAWGDDYDPCECTDDGRSGEEVRNSSLRRAKAVLAHLGIPDLSKQGEG